MIRPAEQALLPHRRAKPRAARGLGQVRAARESGGKLCASTPALCAHVAPVTPPVPSSRGTVIHSVAARNSGPRPTSPSPYIPWPPVVSLSLPLTFLQIRGALSLSLVPRRHAALSWPAVPGLRPCRRRGRCVRPWPGRREPPQRRGAAPRARGCETVPPRPPPPPAEQPTAGRPGLTTSRSALLLTFLLIKEHRTTQVEFEKNIGVQMHFCLLSEIVLTVGCAKFEFVQGMRNFLKLCRVHGRVGPRGPQPRAARPRACVGSARHGPSWSRGPPPQPRAFKLCF